MCYSMPLSWWPLPADAMLQPLETYPIALWQKLVMKQVQFPQQRTARGGEVPPVPPVPPDESDEEWKALRTTF